MATTSDRAIASKNIFLFSDGTGNSSAKLQKTNVWRLYEALDLGPSPAPDGAGPPSPAQIAFYDNGVGTSSVPLLAALGGVFGWGLARNVRGLYKFLCRNYRPGDRIFAFGFSRGAFTIRILVSMITQMGIIRYDTETDLDLQVHDVWRCYREPYQPYLLKGIARLLRAIVRWMVGAKRAMFGQRGYGEALAAADRFDPDDFEIEFVGVWDTVAAYGGPIIEVTRAIDMMIWPLTMNDFALDRRVKCARHALAIDDKRDSFVPLLWDEVHEASLVADKVVPVGRLEQLWFAGMHSDVGGGYADETLSFVSLRWMINQAQVAGARLLPDLERRIRTMANQFGPVHDSRNGIGMFYRYQPRPICAWLQPRRPSSWIHLDPSVKRGSHNTQTNRLDRHARGLLCAPLKVHHSVVARLAGGTDAYAPNNLPARFDVVDDSGTVVDRVAGNRAISSAAPWTRQTIMRRRIYYFLAIFILCAFLIAMPFWPPVPESWPRLVQRVFNSENDARDIAGPIYAAISGVLPNFTHRWTDVFVNKFWLTVPIVVVLVAVIARGNGLERGMTDYFTLAYRGTPGRPPRAGRLYRRLSRNAPVQWLLARWKWYIVPFFVGLILLFGAALAVAGSLTQLYLYFFKEGRECRGVELLAVPADAPAAQQEAVPFGYAVDRPCNYTGVQVTKGQTYSLELHDADWQDGSVETTPTARIRETAGEWSLDLLGVPFRRVMRAPYMAPLIQIRNKIDAVAVERPATLSQTKDVWIGRFVAPRSGRLYVYVNDAVLPIDVATDGDQSWPTFASTRTRYRNNRFANGRGKSWGRVWNGLPKVADAEAEAEPPTMAKRQTRADGTSLPPVN